NMCRAHREAYEILHRHRPDAMVGIAHSAPYVVPCNPRNPLDRAVATVRDYILNHALFRRLGRTLDFIGLNYYARQVARWRPTPRGTIVGVECLEDHHGSPRHFSTLGWEVYPRGLREVLLAYRRYGLPLMITENGIATDDEAERTQ